MADEPIDAWLKPYERPDGVQAGDGGLSRVGNRSAAAHRARWLRAGSPNSIPLYRHVGDVAGARRPDARAMSRDMREGAAQLAQPMRLAADMRMQRDRAHQRGARCACSSISSNWSTIRSAKSSAVMRRTTMALRVVGFLRIGHRQQRPGARRERDRPVVVAPVEHVVVAGFLQEIGRDVALGDPRAEPAARAACLPGARSRRSPRRSARVRPPRAIAPAAPHWCGHARRSRSRASRNAAISSGQTS